MLTAYCQYRLVVGQAIGLVAYHCTYRLVLVGRSSVDCRLAEVSRDCLHVLLCCVEDEEEEEVVMGTVSDARVLLRDVGSLGGIVLVVAVAACPDRLSACRRVSALVGTTSSSSSVGPSLV